MAKYKQSNRASLEARFDFAEDSLARIEGLWDSHLRLATGYDDGEPYLVRLFRKSGTTLDDDLKAIIARGLRRIRRVLSSRQAREVLVEVLEIAEDAEEIAIVMVDPGSPVAGTARRRAKQGRFLTSGSRVAFWSNIKRIAEALALCHSAGIVHGAVSQYTIFSQSDDSVDYRLGGIEACVHIADGSIGESGHLLRTSGAVSFRQDWIDLARVIASPFSILTARIPRRWSPSNDG